jgi:ATP-dependent Clp protease ATP-binding subunit ClpA
LRNPNAGIQSRGVSPRFRAQLESGCATAGYNAPRPVIHPESAGGIMFERFTDRARKVMALANEEAQRFNHEYIGTEHILLGLLKEASGVGAAVLKNLGLDLRTIRLEIEKLVKSGPDMVTMGKLPQTPRAKQVVAFAIEEARKLNHNYVGTEHLLLGLVREFEGVAAQVLTNLGLKLEDVREEVLNLLGAGIEPESPSNPAEAVAALAAMANAQDPRMPPFGDDAFRLNQMAVGLAAEQNAAEVTVEHYLLAMLLMPETRAGRALKQLGVSSDQVLQALRELR